MELLSDEALERSAVVANCRMNRERNLLGSNGYEKELGFNPLDDLKARAAGGRPVAWLDLCCGTGRALFEAARAVPDAGLALEIVGVDLVGMFPTSDAIPFCLRLVQASLSTWRPERRFDIITCVHGLHYIGDKLGLIVRAVSWLADDGLFVANLALANLKLAGGQAAGRKIASDLRRVGVQYDPRRKLIRFRGRHSPDLPYRYLGADDRPGPNYTGQPAVDSYYEVTPGPLPSA